MNVRYSLAHEVARYHSTYNPGRGGCDRGRGVSDRPHPFIAKLHPGKHRANGHYHKRGAVAAVIAIAAFVAAGYWAYRLRRPKEAAPVVVATYDSAAQVLSGPPTTTGDGSNEEGTA